MVLLFSQTSTLKPQLGQYFTPAFRSNPQLGHLVGQLATGCVNSEAVLTRGTSLGACPLGCGLRGTNF
jgi:hypothetical protein